MSKKAFSSRFAPDTRIGPYSLVVHLGHGAFGEVWLAEKDSALAKIPIALKLPLDHAVDIDAIRKEAELWSRAANHPNVLPIFEADIYDGQVIIASEYAPDGSLERWLTKHGRQAPSAEIAADMVMGILSGLEHLHVRGIVHRDLKPDNILMQGEYPRIADFGLAQLLNASMTFSQAGTPLYMAPEAFLGERTAQTDLWSVGIMLYEILEGRHPFPATNLKQLREAVTLSPPLPLSDTIPKQIERIVRTALQKDPLLRYRSAADMRAELRDATRRLGTAASADTSSSFRGGRTIAITGSVRADPLRTWSILRTLVAPYCSPQTTWYCGTVGVADEHAAEFLLRKGQRVISVGYGAADISAEMLSILKHFDAPFVDAQNEKVPPDPGAPSKRDIFFSTKADLVIVLWDGESQGTGQLLEWLERQGKDHLVAYTPRSELRSPEPG